MSDENNVNNATSREIPQISTHQQRSLIWLQNAVLNNYVKLEAIQLASILRVKS
ncbi:hypothetical protein [Alteromonas sp. MmMcT2-5]|uniref:hypothetical protein n=1 Tax=Alteromonas sp. MmMcT2-5 TaxID=2917733 RepID=UPI001EF2DBA4|nr:hypothetical protein [Alteromonas sp. MmMcT2-5]MCG7649100.1 hypothetical protein [Alteromonas sp. MmMcT2-5]